MELEIKTKNPEIAKILEKYNHYGYMKFDDLQAFKDYHAELGENLADKRFTVKYSPVITDEHFKYLEAEFEHIDYINHYKIYNSTMVSLMVMNGVLRQLWEQEFSGYSNNAFFDFKKLCEMINAYWEIETPYKPSNKIAYGWKFSMEKADNTGYYCKGWKLYMWGCIKNYLIKNGVEFTKEESLKVRKIVGLVDIYDTTE